MPRMLSVVLTVLGPAGPGGSAISNRTTLPPQHRIPSPKVKPEPPPIALFPWKNRPGWFVVKSTLNLRSSAAVLFVPDADRTAPWPTGIGNPFAQPPPEPGVASLVHAQAVALPSPKQKLVNGGEGPRSCTNTSETSLVSCRTRFDARLSKAIRRPSAVIDGA